MLDYVLENTLDNYEKFVCQYWLQNVLRLKAYPNTPLQINTHTVLKYLHNNQTFLELTPLHLISDEDAIKIAEIFGTKDDLLFVGKFLCNGMFDNSGDCEENILYNSNAKAVDYLRSKGYSLPYNGLSVEEMISRGWVVLKTKF